MSRDIESPKKDDRSSCLPESEQLVEGGYQPQGGPVNPCDLKPPHGDTAIVPPEKAARKQ